MKTLSPHHIYTYVFLQPKDSLAGIAAGTVEGYKDAFAQSIASYDAVRVYPYTTLGMKSDTSFMLWIQSSSIEDMQEFLVHILHTDLGRHLRIVDTLFGIKRRSAYGNKGTAESQEVIDQERLPYLTVYPFTKTTDWYLLPFEERRSLMHEHIKTGYKYAHIKQHLLYSIGLDDPEFIVAYETKSLEEFQDLVMDMRSTKVRAYTMKDTPIYTCIYKPFPEVLRVI